MGLPPCPAFSLLFSPIPLPPFPAGRGSPKVYFAGGFAPGTPALNRLRHLQLLPSRHPAQGACGSPQKRQEAVPYEQCRQPRRGGTGGEELRRLRWSSPPGQGEQVPLGFSPRRVPPTPAEPTRLGQAPRRARNMLPAPAPQNKSCCRSFF